MEQTAEITRIHVCAHVEEIVRNIQMDSVLKKKAALDVQESYNQYVAKRELLMTISVTYNAPRISF